MAEKRCSVAVVALLLACNGGGSEGDDGASASGTGTSGTQAPTSTTQAPGTETGDPPGTSDGTTSGAPTTGGPDTTTTATTTSGESSTTADTTGVASTGAGLTLEVVPAGPKLVVEVPLSGQTVAFQCVDALTDAPVADAVWSVDSEALGTIGADGVYTPNGSGIGAVEVTCESAGESAATTLQLGLHVVDNPAGLTPEQQDALIGGEPAPDPTMKLLYPYADTVFPRDIPPPQIHLTPGDFPGDVVAVHILFGDFEYEGFFAASPVKPQVALPEPSWDLLTSVARGQTVQVEVTKQSGMTVHGAVTQPWRIADGAIHGVVYYTTYDSPLAMNNGATLRVDPATTTPEVIVANCTVCHNASDDGSTLAAANHNGQGGTFDLFTAPATPLWVDAELAAFAGMHPQGDLLVVQAAPGGSYPPNTPGTSGPYPSSLRTRTGELIADSGIEAYYAQTPAFSHDGTRLAFTDRATVPMLGKYPGKLAIMDFDPNGLVFTNHTVVATPPQGRQYSWPSFTPDGGTILFQDGVGEDLATWDVNTGKIWAVDIASKQVVALDRLNGDGYVPQGARDEDKNYEPFVSAVPSGGYAWVVFASRRTYGNELTGTRDQTKRLWMAAYDLNAPPGTDGSHPAFYLSGQELTSGNHRGTLVLGECRAAEEACSTGDQCCDGYCNAGACGPADGECADEFEPCVTAADCCDAGQACINARCAAVP